MHPLSKVQILDTHIRGIGRIVTLLALVAVISYIAVFTPFISNIAMTVQNVAQVNSALP